MTRKLELAKLDLGWFQETLHVSGSKMQFLAIGLAVLHNPTSAMCQQCMCKSKPSIQGTCKSRPSIQYYAVL